MGLGALDFLGSFWFQFCADDAGIPACEEPGCQATWADDFHLSQSVLRSWFSMKSLKTTAHYEAVFRRFRESFYSIYN